MNKNEEKQRTLFKAIVKSCNDNNIDSVFTARDYSVRNSSEPYDVIFTSPNKIVYIQLTTMSNIVLNKKGEVQHANHIENQANFDYESETDSYLIDQVKESFYKKVGIKRELEAKEHGSELVLKSSTSYPIIGKKEVDFSKKYLVEDGGIINSLVRSLNKKLNNYKLNHKEESSLLVILDISQNTIVNKCDRNSKIKCTTTIKDFYRLLLYYAMQEVEDNGFFDDVNVYFSMQNNKGMSYLAVKKSDKIHNNIVEESLCYFVIPMNNIHAITIIYNNDEDIKFKK